MVARHGCHEAKTQSEDGGRGTNLHDSMTTKALDVERHFLLGDVSNGLGRADLEAGGLAGKIGVVEVVGLCCKGLVPSTCQARSDGVDDEGLDVLNGDAVPWLLRHISEGGAHWVPHSVGGANLEDEVIIDSHSRVVVVVVPLSEEDVLLVDVCQSVCVAMSLHDILVIDDSQHSLHKLALSLCFVEEWLHGALDKRQVATVLLCKRSGTAAMERRLEEKEERP